MTLLHRIEARAARAAVWLLRRLSPTAASALFGGLMRTLGPILPVSRIADRNLRLMMPELDTVARRRVVRGMWDNLGRTVGEFVHLGTLNETSSGPGWEVVGAEHIRALVAQGGPAILFTGHIANWEMLSLATARLGLPVAGFYRAADNPEIDALIMELRRLSPGNATMFPKGAQGARQALLHLRKGGSLGFLQDQKMNDGIEARFFGQPAMTASALASLALKIRCPVVPTFVQRIGPVRFRVTYEPPMNLPDTGNRTEDISALTQAVNDRLEDWVRARPESWLWVHRRWPKSLYADLR